MMYKEFLEKFGCTENYISFSEYNEEIEPIYTNGNLSQLEFCKLLNDVFNKIVIPAVEEKIHRYSIDTKIDYINGDIDLKSEIETIDRQARKIAYDYIKLLMSL